MSAIACFKGEFMVKCEVTQSTVTGYFLRGRVKEKEILFAFLKLATPVPKTNTLYHNDYTKDLL